MTAAPQHWDFVLSCFEAVGMVSGGIGTYTRLLLELLGVHPRLTSRKILFVTSERHKSDNLAEFGPNIVHEYLPEAATLDGRPINNLHNPYRHFAFNLMRRLCDLAREGHTFGTIEVPDYGAEGHYLARARALGFLSFERLAVRLHSPNMMLFDDNRMTGQASVDMLRTFDEERCVYEHADVILFAGDAMRDRIAAYFEGPQQRTFLRKAMKVPHPWPPCLPNHLALAPPSPEVNVGFVGRLEYRKGVDLLVKAALRVLRDYRIAARFHFFGRDTFTYRGGSIREYLAGLIPSELEHAFVFHDYTPQAVLSLEKLPDMDLFAFPSRFENYPNVLLEVLPLGKPILVSKHGCMPEMSRDFPHVLSFDPHDEQGFASLLANAAAPRPDAIQVAEQYGLVVDDKARWIAAAYSKLMTPNREVAGCPETGRAPSIAFIVPHYNKACWLDALFDSIAPQMSAGDEVVVVDDASRPDEAFRARQAVEARGWRFVQLEANAGPGVARNVGTRASSAELLYFVDADDELCPNTVDILRGVLSRMPGVDVAYGFMEAFGDEEHYWASWDPSIRSILTDNCSHCGIVIRRSTFERVGGYAQREKLLHWEDWEFNIRLVLNGAVLTAVPVITYRYRVDKRQGRNWSGRDQVAESHAALLRHALGSVGQHMSDMIWPEVSKVLVENLVRNSVHY